MGFSKRFLVCAVALVWSLGTWALQAQPATRVTSPQLSPAEQTAGWRLLFDGATTKGWRGFKKAEFPKSGWTIESGRFKHASTGGEPSATSGGDIITIETFNDFELRFEWII